MRKRRRLCLGPEAFDVLEPRRLLAGDTACWVESPVDVETPADSEIPLAAEALEGTTLRLITPQRFLPGIPFLVRVQVEDPQGDVDRDVWQSEVSLTSQNPNVVLATQNLTLVNGLGSVLVTVAASEPFELAADWNGVRDLRQLTPWEIDAIPTVSGTLPGASSHWNNVIRVTGDVLVPVDHVLTIDPGTLVLVDGVPQTPQVQLGARIQVQGTLRAEGTPADPVTVTATDPQQPWGEIHVDGGEVSLLNTILTRAGNSPRGGHTSTGPALRLASNGSLVIESSSITDINGKILQGSGGQLTIHDSLLSRAVMGPEISNTSLDFENSWIIEMAGIYHHNGTVDDNDGIYLHEQRAGQLIQMRHSVVAGVQDDGIDTLGSDVLLQDVIIRDVTDKAISVFNGETTVQRSLLVNADIGIETKGAGTSTARTVVDQTTIANVNWAIRAHDKGSPDPDVQITYDIRNSILHVSPGGDALFTDYDPADLHVNYTWVAEPWEHAGSGTGNLLSEPEFADLPQNDYRLRPGSLAIDAGDPESPWDADGTRPDLGYRPYSEASGPLGDFNGDGQIDAADLDLLCAAIGASAPEAAFDLNQSGTVDESDLDTMLTDLLKTTRGDANLDGIFDSSDLVLVFQAGQYEDTVGGNSGWATGDWNCDGEFTTDDLVAAFQAGSYQ